MVEIKIPIGSSATTRSIGDVAALVRDIPADATITIDASELAEADLSLVQLLEALRRHARATGQPISLSEPANACLTQVLRRAGFLTAPTEDDTSFWFHGDLPQ